MKNLINERRNSKDDRHQKKISLQHLNVNANGEYFQQEAYRNEL